VLSLLEILYFLTLRLCCESRKGKQIGYRLNKATSSAWKKAVAIGGFDKYVNAFKTKDKLGGPVSKRSIHVPYLQTRVDTFSQRIIQGTHQQTISHSLGMIPSKNFESGFRNEIDLEENSKYKILQNFRW
jgi:hypothetical protein